MSLKCWI